MTQPRDFIDKVSRIALAIQRAGPDAEGSVETLHQDLIDIILLVPKRFRETPDRTSREEPPSE